MTTEGVRPVNSAEAIAELAKLLHEARAENTALGVRIQDAWAEAEDQRASARHAEAERDDLRARLTEAVTWMRDIAREVNSEATDNAALRPHHVPKLIRCTELLTEAADRAAPSEGPAS